VEIKIPSNQSFVSANIVSQPNYFYVYNYLKGTVLATRTKGDPLYVGSASAWSQENPLKVNGIPVSQNSYLGMYVENVSHLFIPTFQLIPSSSIFRFTCMTMFASLYVIS